MGSMIRILKKGLGLGMLFLATAGATAPEGCSSLSDQQKAEIRQFCGEVRKEVDGCHSGHFGDAVIDNCWIVPNEKGDSCFNHFRVGYQIPGDDNAVPHGAGYLWLARKDCRVLRRDRVVRIACFSVTSRLDTLSQPQ
jgi:hypothetical protein